jgi:hypothetical protein
VDGISLRVRPLNQGGAACSRTSEPERGRISLSDFTTNSHTTEGGEKWTWVKLKREEMMGTTNLS